MEAKAVTNNREKAKSRKKRDPLEVHLAKLESIQVGGVDLTGEDIAAVADALAGATVAQKAIKKTIDDAKAVLKAAMFRQYCEHYAQKGRPPELRKSISTTGRFNVVQQKTAKVSAAAADKLKAQGLDIEAHIESRSYTVRMGNASKEEQKKIVASLKDILGDGYADVVSEDIKVGDRFFGSFDDIVKKTLADGENLDEKMLRVLRVLNPTVQYQSVESDLSEAAGFDLAFEFSQVSAERDKAAKAAAKEAESIKRASA